VPAVQTDTCTTARASTVARADLRRVARLSYFLTEPDIEMPSALTGKSNGERVTASPVDYRRSGAGQCRSSVSEVRGGAPAKDENDFGAFLREKPPLVNRVIKC